MPLLTPPNPYNPFFHSLSPFLPVENETGLELRRCIKILRIPKQRDDSEMAAEDYLKLMVLIYVFLHRCHKKSCAVPLFFLFYWVEFVHFHFIRTFVH